MSLSVTFTPAMTVNFKLLDDEFYLEDLYLLVEDRLFKVPKRGFQCSDSEVFSVLFELPPQGGEAEGSSSDNPLCLDTIVRHDFVCFLHVLYPKNPCEEPTLTDRQWISVLRLAALWGFTSIKAKAIANLHGVLERDPLQAVKLADDPRTGLEGWMVPAVGALARRAAPLSPDEARALGLELALKVMHVRERAFEGVARLGSVWDAGAGRLVTPRRETWDFAEDIGEIFCIRE